MAPPNDSGSSGAVISFAQQGTVDWTALGGATYTTSIEVLARLSSAGVEPLTMAFGQAVCSRIELGPHGQKVLMDSLGKLTAFSSFGDIVWFGVGVKHILRSIVQTAEGCSLVALAGALSECFETRMAAMVLYEMSRLLKAPSEFSPSLAQWEALVKCSACIFKGSTFGITLEHFLSLAGPRKASAVYDKEPGHPQDLARILLALGQIKRGELRQIKVQGSVSCCWLATFASFILGLRVHVHSDNDLLYQNYDEGDADAQLQINLAPHIIESSALSNFQTSFVVRDGYEFVDQWYNAPNVRSGRQLPTLVGGDVSWDTLFGDVFPVEAKLLLNTPGSEEFELFCSLFQTGSEILARSTPCSASHGGDSAIFTTPTTSLLTELHLLRHSPRRSWLQDKSAQLIETYGRILTDMRSLCCCHSCVLAPDDSPSIPHTYCLPYLAEMILALSCRLDICEITSQLRPKRSAIIRFYFKILHGRRPSYGLMHLCDIETLVNHLTFGAFGYKSAKSYDLLNSFILLFTGIEIERPPSDKFPSACSSGGVFCYFNGLTSLSTDYQKSVKVIIGAGAIECRSRSYDFVFDKNITSADAYRYDKAEIKTSTDFDILWSDTSSHDLELEAVVENVQHLIFYYQIKSSKGKVIVSPASFIYQKLIPSALTKLTARLEALPPKFSRAELTKENFRLAVASGEGPTEFRGPGIILRPLHNNVLGQCVSLYWGLMTPVLVTNDTELDTFLSWYAKIYKQLSDGLGSSHVYSIISI